MSRPDLKDRNVKKKKLFLKWSNSARTMFGPKLFQPKAQPKLCSNRAYPAYASSKLCEFILWAAKDKFNTLESLHSFVIAACKDDIVR